MHNRFTYILIGVWATLFVACGSIYDDGQCVDLDQRITFRLSVASPNTRTTWADNYPSTIGTSFDNMISLNGLRVAIHNASDNSYIGEVSNLIHWNVSDNVYQFVGEVTNLNLTANAQYKIMVYANCPPGTASDNLSFEYTTAQYPNGAIPMWGVTESTLSLVGNQDIGTIHLLRALAKVEVNLAPAMADYHIEKVTVNSINHYGYCLPNNWDTVTNSATLNRENSINEYRSVIYPQGGIEFTAVSSTSSVIYLPDYNNFDSLIPAAKLSVTLRDSSDNLYEFKDALSFGNYVDGALSGGTAYNIVRNHYYKFNIIGVAGGLEIDYQVADWDEGGTWDYGEFAYPTYHNPILPDEWYYNSKFFEVITVEPTMSYNATDDEAGAFSGWFHISAPVGHQWVPTFTQSESDYEIRVYKNGVRVTNPAEFVAGADWYNIKIVPLNPDLVGNKVKFGISYTASWMNASTSLYLFINGKSDAIAWKNSGTDPKIIEITQN